VLCLSLCEQFVLPAAYRHQGELAQTAAAMKQVGVSPHLGQLNRATHLVRAMEDAVEDLRGAIAKQQSSETEMAQAQCCRDAVLPAMLAAREAADAIETSVAVDLWPLSPYRDILFML
jgi:glutamine synthetase